MLNEMITYTVITYTEESISSHEQSVLEHERVLVYSKRLNIVNIKTYKG